MSTIEKMREVADLLVRQKKFDEAYTIFDELFHQIWGVFGSVQCNFSGYSTNPVGTRFSFDPMLRKQFPEPAANALCLRIHNINLSLVLDEFIRVMYGHLQCISSSWHIHREISSDVVLTEFAVLYTLVLQPLRQRRLSPIFSIATAIVDRNSRLKRIISHYPRSIIEKLLVENAQNCKDNKWKTINHILSDYLLRIGDRKSEFFKKVSNTVDPSYYRFQYNRNHSDRYENYKRYDHYERYRQQTSSSSRNFYSLTATDEEKKEYYGQLIGLKGKVTKEQIRSKYIGLISLYHPDRVQHLGPELKELAEMKSKEINAAYDWLKTKYHF
jgi:hypothetical protein